MATEKWVAGATGASTVWASAFGTEIASVSAGNAILSSVSISNGTNLDIFSDFSYVAGAAINGVAPCFLGIYVYPINGDNSTYGDGRFGSAAAGPPPTNYYRGSISCATSTALTISGVAERLVIPPGTFKFVVYNQMGATLPTTSGLTCAYRTYNRSVA